MTALHHPVAAPRKDELRALIERTANLRRRFAALRDLTPERVVDTFGCEDAAELCESTTERLPGVCDDGDLHLRSSAAAPAARHANTTTINAATPTTSPPATSRGWCMPRYIREAATNVTIARARVHTARPKSGVAETGREQQRESAVDSQRSCGVAGRVAGVHGQVLEANNARPVRVDDERGGSVRRRLDREREDGECRDPPFLERDAHERDRPRRRSATRRHRRRSSRSATRVSDRESGARRATCSRARQVSRCSRCAPARG